jgi:hypothetical protein
MNRRHRVFVFGNTTAQLSTIFRKCRLSVIGACPLPERLLQSNSRAAGADLLVLVAPQLRWLKTVWLLKNSEQTKSIPLIVIVQSCSGAELMCGYNLGADYVLSGQATAEQLGFALNSLFPEEEKKRADAQRKRRALWNSLSGLGRLRILFKGEKTNGREQTSVTNAKQGSVPVSSCRTCSGDRARHGVITGDA